MTKPISALAILFLHALFLCNAQTTELQGFVRDKETNAALVGTTMELTATDSVLARTQTDDTGKFSLAFHPMATELRIRHSGYADTSVLLALHDLERDLTIHLQRAAVKIQEVVVEEKMPNIAFDGEKMVINNAHFANSSLDGLDALGKIPGAFLEGNSLTINGRSDYIILFNGIQTTMDNAQAIQMLKAMSPELIDRIELTLGGSASQDASAGGGVINVVTKEPFSRKYWVVLNNRMIVDEKNVSSNHNGSFYYRVKNFSAYYFPAVSNNRNYSSSQVNSTYFDDDGSFSSLAVNGNANNRELYWTNSLGLNYDLGKRTKLGLFSLLNFDDYHSDGSNLTVSEGKTNYSTRYTNRSRSDAQFNTLNFNVDHKIDTLGSDLKFLVGRIGGYSKEWSDLEYDYLSAQDNMELRNHAPLDGSQFLTKLDFKKVFRSGNRLEMGFKGTFGKLDNDFMQDTLAPVFSLASGISPFKTRYRENITAGYAMTVLKFGVFFVLPGLRYEHAAMENLYARSGDRFKLRFSDFFPSIRFGINKPKISSSISVSRSIYRPPFAYVNDYERQINNYSYERGNPNLSPQFSWNFGLNNFIYNFLYFNLGFSKAEDVIVRTTRPEADGLYTIIQPNNALDRKMLYLNTGAGYDRIKNLEFNFGFSGSMARYDIKKGFEYVNPSQKWHSSYNFWVSSTYKLPKNFTITNQFGFNSWKQNQQSRTRPAWQDNISLRKSFPQNNRFKVMLSVTDVFKSYRSATRTVSPQYFSDSRAFPISRKVMLGLSFDFGKLNKSVNVDDSLEEDAGRFVKERD